MSRHVGWSFTDDSEVTWHLGYLPGRRAACLWYQNRGTVYPVMWLSHRASKSEVDALFAAMSLLVSAASGEDIQAAVEELEEAR